MQTTEHAQETASRPLYPVEIIPEDVEIREDVVYAFGHTFVAKGGRWLMVEYA